MRIKHWFKKKKWERLLGDVLKSSTKAKSITLTIKGETICTVSKEEGDESRSKSLIFPIKLNGEEIGYLKISGNGVSEEIKFWESVGNLIQYWTDIEYARRATADELLDKYRELSFLNRVAFALGRSLDLKTVVSTLLQECQKVVPPVKFGAVLLYDDSNQLTILTAFGEGTEDNAKKIAEMISRTELFREVLSSQKPEIVNAVSEDPRWNISIEGISSFLGAPLVSSKKKLGGLFLAGDMPFSSLHLKSISTLTALGSTAIANALHFAEIQKLLESFIISLTTAIDSRDPCTAGHSQRTAKYATALAEAINKDNEYFAGFQFSPSEIREIYYAALLHDVGKLGVREKVLAKATKLSKEGMKSIRLRLLILEEFKKSHPDLPDIDEIYARLEKINSNGYLSQEDREFVLKLADVKLQIGGKVIPLLEKEEVESLLIPTGNLLPRELEEIRKHPAESVRILEQIPFPEDMLNLKTIIKQHHEKLDGSGYPDGKKGEEILLQSRILAVCDIYDALTASDRPYKKALSTEKVIDILRDMAKSGKLDSRVVEVFIREVIKAGKQTQKAALTKTLRQI